MIPNMSVVVQVMVVYITLFKQIMPNIQGAAGHCLCLVNRWFLVKRLLAVMIIQKNKHPFYLEKYKRRHTVEAQMSYFYTGTWKQPTLVDLCALNLSQT